MVPLAIDAFDRIGFEPEGVNFPRRAEHAGDDRYFESFDVFEHQRRPLVRRDFFEELAADRGDLPILVDFLGDALEFAFFFRVATYSRKSR